MSEEELKQIAEEEYESPYCEVCGHCGEIGCCGIRNFIEEHIKGKTNCKNEDIIINELIDLCDYKDEVFNENKQLKEEKKQVINLIKRSAGYKGICTQPDTDTFCKILFVLGDKENENNNI